MTNAGHFKKGIAPWNKGDKGRRTSPATEFKTGATPHNFKGIGVPSIVGKRREVIATTTTAHTTAVSRGKIYTTKRRTSYARYLWEEANGAIPAGCVVYNTGDPEAIKLEELELITRAELMRRNTGR